MTPQIGQSVLVLVDPEHANGADVAPAVITRVWTAEMVSVRVFHDGPCTPDCTDRATVILYESREAARTRDPKLRPSGAFWPPQEPGAAQAAAPRPWPGPLTRSYAACS